MRAGQSIEEEGFEALGVSVGQIELLCEVLDVECDIAIFVGDVVGADELLVIEVGFEEGTIESVDLVYDLLLHATIACLVVQHLGEDGQLRLGELRL